MQLAEGIQAISNSLPPRDAARADQASGFIGRAAFIERLRDAMGAARRAGDRIAVFVVDLDRFRLVNERWGHLAGDRVLKEVALRLRRTLRGTDVLTRLGGDQFAALTPGVPGGEGAAAVARKVLDAMRAPFAIGADTFSTTASVGIALFPDHGADEHGLIRAADRALADAKRRGRDGVRLYSSALGDVRGHALDLEHDLRLGLARSELELRFQPVHDLGSGRVDSVETLVRWRHPLLGLLPPDRFIPMAEETGLVRSLGERVLEGACAQLALWRAEGLPLAGVSVNLSARDFERPDFVEFVTDTLARHALPPDALEIEVTEHSLFEDPDAAARAVALGEYGVKLSIDDFGTKYASLAYLQRLPVNTIKVDRSFVRDIGYSSSSDSIVAAVIALARGMGLRLIAEGVEEIDQVRSLRRLGCHVMQGFLFSRPLAADDAYRYLARRAG
ncbi:MAG: bifunctional diguanylate cyclase/phosphodiesterase [Burkholderiales bacterium]|nr:bifunctional diguanylate cyclase/phosphodiesterase [Burkholderiales bacterium]